MQSTPSSTASTAMAMVIPYLAGFASAAIQRSAPLAHASTLSRLFCPGKALLPRRSGKLTLFAISRSQMSSERVGSEGFALATLSNGRATISQALCRMMRKGSPAFGRIPAMCG